MTDRPDNRDRLAETIMLKALDRDWSLWRDPAFLTAQSYRIADAMINQRQNGGQP